jgi:hypothetical protein
MLMVGFEPTISAGERPKTYALGLIHTRDTGIRFTNEGNKRNKEASGTVQTRIPVGDTYEILKFSLSGWSAASIL